MKELGKKRLKFARNRQSRASPKKENKEKKEEPLTVYQKHSTEQKKGNKSIQCDVCPMNLKKKGEKRKKKRTPKTSV